MAKSAPIILTATMAPADFAWADALRRTHFPPGRNRTPAHITLFRHLPPSIGAELADALRRICGGPAPRARLAGILRFDGGVAFAIDSPGLLGIRADLADRFHGLLQPQDAATPRLHVTIQNKADPQAARRLADALDAGFRPRPLAIAGLATWHYADGGWEAIRARSFRGGT